MRLAGRRPVGPAPRRIRRHHPGQLPRPRVHRPRLLAGRGPGGQPGSLCPLRPARRVPRHARRPTGLPGASEGTYRSTPDPARHRRAEHRHREPHGPHLPGHRGPHHRDRRVRRRPGQHPADPAQRRSARRRPGDGADGRGARPRGRHLVPGRGLRRLHRTEPVGDGRLAGRVRLRRHRHLHRRPQPRLRPAETHGRVGAHAVRQRLAVLPAVRRLYSPPPTAAAAAVAVRRSPTRYRRAPRPPTTRPSRPRRWASARGR